jgi:2,4-dienoyl-CoA reductase-like NADH-dependent reductase (Old Yellow Enzyme family)
VVDAVTAAVGVERTGVHLAAERPERNRRQRSAKPDQSRGICPGKGLPYLHVIEGDTGGTPVPPFDYLAIKRLFGGPVIANNGFDKERANEAIEQGRADLVAFGKPFIGNPDLVTRLYLNAPLAPVNRETLYGGAEQGYTDYPTLRAVGAAPLLRRRGTRLGMIVPAQRPPSVAAFKAAAQLCMNDFPVGVAGQTGDKDKLAWFRVKARGSEQ